MNDAPPADEVMLRVPAQPPYARIVRVGAAAIALRQGMSFTEIDDVRLAIDESLILLLDGADEETHIDCIFRVAAGDFEFEATVTGDNAIAAEAIDRFDDLAAGLLDDYDIDPQRAWLRIRKYHVDDPDD